MTNEIKDQIIAAANRRCSGIPTLSDTPNGFEVTIPGLYSSEPEEDGIEGDPSLRDEIAAILAARREDGMLNPDKAGEDYDVNWSEDGGNSRSFIEIVERSFTCEDCCDDFLPSFGFCADDMTLCRDCAAKDEQEAAVA